MQFDSEIFELYASHGTKDAVQTEKGGKTVWQTSKFRKIAAMVVFCILGGSSLFFWAFSSFGKAPKSDATELAATDDPAAKQPTEHAATAASEPRIAGVVYQHDRAKIVIERRGAFEVIDSADFVVTETRISGVVDGAIVQWP